MDVRRGRLASPLRSTQDHLRCRPESSVGTVNSPRQNRVGPLGDILATSLRGSWMGNRGILHDDDGIARSYASNAWITCALSFKDWRAQQWEPHHYTVLFFHDETVSLAAGHRPCAMCRRADYNAYRSALAEESSDGILSAKDLDRQLHQERIVAGRHQAGTLRRRLQQDHWAALPDGSFVIVDGESLLVLGKIVVPWSPEGYGAARERPDAGVVDVITPASSLAALRGGYRPQIDAAALRQAQGAGA